MNRRRFVLVAGTAGMVGVAGCLGFGDDENGDGDDENGDGDDEDGNGDDENGNGDANGEANGDEPSELDAAFSVAPAEPLDGQEVTLDASASTGDIETFRWDLTGTDEFDLETEEPTATHTFDDTGTRTITLEVETAEGETRTASEPVSVLRSEELPVEFEWDPETPVVGEEVTFDASAIEARDIDIAEYRWDFTGDGTIDETTTAPTVTHSFDTAETVQVRLEIEGEGGRTNNMTQGVPVVSPITIAFDWNPSEPDRDEEVTFDASESTSEAGSIVEYRWDFTGNVEFDETTTDPVTTHAFEEERSVPVMLEVEDEAGNTERRSKSVWVSDEDINVDLEVEPREPDAGESVTFEASSSAEVDQYEWDFTGDGEIDETTTDGTVTRTFDQDGLYPIEVRVEGPAGVGTASEWVVVGGVEGLQAEYEWMPAEPDVGQTVTFDASISLGRTAEYRWDFTGDGEVDETTTDPTTTHTFDAEAFYPVTLVIESPDGRDDGVTAEIPVGDAEQLEAVLDVTPPGPSAGEEVTLDASESTGNIVAYRWAVTTIGDTPDEVESGETTEPTFTWTADETGEYAIELEVEDVTGAVAFDLEFVNVGE